MCDHLDELLIKSEDRRKHLSGVHPEMNSENRKNKKHYLDTNFEFLNICKKKKRRTLRTLLPWLRNKKRVRL